MRIVPLIVLICVGWQMANAQSRIEKQKETEASTLQLRLDLVGQTYCSRNNLRLNLRFTYSNVGSETVILYRHGSFISRYLLSKNLDDLNKRRYEYDVSPMLGPQIPPEVDSQTPDERLFVLIRPGESFTMDKYAHLLINNSKPLRPGFHFLQLRVATSYINPALTDALAIRWRSVGKLWTKDLLTLPRQLVIEPFVNFEQCGQLQKSLTTKTLFLIL